MRVSRCVYFFGAMAILLLAAQTSFSAEDGQSFDFRKARWGMLDSEVIDAERGSATLKKIDKNKLIYITETLGCEAIVAYEFDETGKLYSATSILSLEKEQNGKHIFETISKQLTEKYGPRKGDLDDSELSRLLDSALQTYISDRTWITLANIQKSISLQYVEAGVAKKLAEERSAEIKKEMEAYEKKRAKDLSQF